MGPVDRADADRRKSDFRDVDWRPVQWQRANYSRASRPPTQHRARADGIGPRRSSAGRQPRRRPEAIGHHHVAGSFEGLWLAAGASCAAMTSALIGIGATVTVRGLAYPLLRLSAFGVPH